MSQDQKIDELINYWVSNSQEKLKTLKQLYSAKRYADALYYGHMIMEMILKALAVQTIGKPVARTHNLKFLVELAGLDLEAKEVQLIVRANEFNMEARYPSEKLEFYKLCTKSYADQYYQPILSLYKKLCQKVK
jgi:HEPN domain-containing protein